MKVTGPGSPTGAPPEGTGAPDAKVDKTGAKGAAGVEKPEAAGRTFAETLAAGRPQPGAAAAKGAGAADPLTADIAADLKAGRIDAKAAIERVVERVLDQQLGADAPAQVRAQLRDALRDTISSDPLLAERLRALG
jgi:hypothetical protein